jgi:hypothetical protein
MKQGHRVRGPIVAGFVACALHGGALAANAGVECPPEPVRVAMPDFPAGDFLRGKGDRFVDHDPGHLVRELREVERSLGCRFQLVRLPLARTFREASMGGVDLVSPVPEAMARAQGWIVPRTGDRLNLQLAVGLSTFSLFVTRAREPELRAAWASERRPAGTVGVILGSLPADHAKAQGWKTQVIQDWERGLTMLTLQRVDHVLAPAISLADNERLRRGEIVALEPPVMPVAYYHAALPGFAERHPDFLRAFWRAACVASLNRRSDRPTCKP